MDRTSIFITKPYYHLSAASVKKSNMNISIIAKLILISILSFSQIVCGQKGDYKSVKNNTINTSKNMDFSKIKNEKVKEALIAQSNGDQNTFFDLFTEHVQFTDDGNALDFKPFFKHAFAHKEQFLSIDKVENNGKDIYGKFDAGTWGIFDVCFKFHQSDNGKFDELHIRNMTKL